MHNHPSCYCYIPIRLRLEKDEDWHSVTRLARNARISFSERWVSSNLSHYRLYEYKQRPITLACRSQEIMPRLGMLCRIGVALTLHLQLEGLLPLVDIRA
ncbi:hypothetical protein Tco_1227574 [Tanacetum coccineum]